jgi:hypothetical protein
MDDEANRAQARLFLVTLDEHATMLRDMVTPLCAATTATLQRELQHVESMMRRIRQRYPALEAGSTNAAGLESDTGYLGGASGTSPGSGRSG